MNRQMFASLSVGLVMTLFVMGSLPLAASEAPYAPLGITETPAATETSTNAPTNTPTAPMNTPTTAPVQSAANTAVPATSTPTPTAASTPTPTRVLVLPVAGGLAEPGDAPSRIPEIIALILGGLAALAIGSDPRARHTPRS